MHLEKYTPSSDEFGERNSLEPLQEKQKTTQEYKILEIVKERKGKIGKKYWKEYQCNWEGYGVTDKWIPEKNFRNAQELLKDWKQRKAKIHRRK